MNFLRVVVCAAALVFVFGYAVLGQQQDDPPPTGTIMGAVSDTSGAPLAGASITISGVNGDDSASTDGQGHYVASGLDPGVYDVTISASGYKDFQKSNIAVSGGVEAQVDAQLEPEGDSPPPQKIDDHATPIGSRIQAQIAAGRIAADADPISGRLSE